MVHRMTLFVLAAIFMLLIGYLFFVPALIGRPGAGRLSRARLNLALHRQRQEELAAEASSPEALQILAAESERHLLGDLEATQEGAASGGQRGRTPLLIMLGLAPVVALVAYFSLGRPDLVASPPERVNRAETEQAIEQLAQRLQANPNDLEGWILLGRSLLATGQPDRAAQAFTFAMKLAPDSLDIKGFYAEALAEANQGSLLGKPAEIIADILRQNPKHKSGLWLAGIAASERGDLAAALRYWETLKAQFAPGSQEAGEIEAFIQKARAEAATTPEAPAAAGKTAPATGGRRVQVRVTLADSLKSQASPEDTVFIFARAAEGPPMPLAVVRKQVRDLPVAVTLDDSLSMMPGMTLSSFERLVIGARVSRSGRPVPTPGDLEGLTEPVTPGPDAAYDIAISRVVAPRP